MRARALELGGEPRLVLGLRLGLGLGDRGADALRRGALSLLANLVGLLAQPLLSLRACLHGGLGRVLLGLARSLVSRLKLPLGVG